MQICTNVKTFILENKQRRKDVFILWLYLCYVFLILKFENSSLKCISSSKSFDNVILGIISADILVSEIIQSLL